MIYLYCMSWVDRKKNKQFNYWGFHKTKEAAYTRAFEAMAKLPQYRFMVGLSQSKIPLLHVLQIALLPFLSLYWGDKGDLT